MSTRPPLADEAAREDARRALGESLLVEAGAGTGKTTLIVERIANLVEAGVPIERVVAITFTEKAAGELKLRVRRALELRSADASRDDRARALAREALAAIERASISTIHAWCARLLREHPVEAGIDPLFAVLDGSAREALFDRVWDAWLSRELAADRDPPIREVSLYTPEEWLRALRSMARHILEHRAWLPGALPAEVGGDPVGDAERTMRAFDPDALAAHASNPDDLLVSALRRVGALRARFLDATPDLRRDMLLRHENLGRNGYERVGNRANWSGTGLGTARAAIDAAQQAWIAARSALANDVLARVARWLCDGFLAEYEEEKRLAGVLDFEDLLVRARDLLRDNAAVRRRVRRGLHLILDEFQDTDPVQCEAAFRLAAEGEPGDWREGAPAPGALFLVGDPKQSIYAFRGADVETYSTARGLLEERRALRAISTNFRSRASVLEWINASFAALLSPPDDAEAARYEIAYAPLDIHHAVNADGNGVHVVRPAKDVEFETIAQSRDAEARTVAALLRDHAHGHWIVRD
ncbi:MAG TPA: UvrD-helicase domain-containing protein, partial [bacterium]|nr:UvrD-helicase domain-containing protein [bacterium]